MRLTVKQRTQIYKTATKTRAWSLKAIGGGGGEAGERSSGLFRDIFGAEGDERWLYLEKGGGGWRWREEDALGWRRRGRVSDGGGVDSYVTASVRTLTPLWCWHTHTHTHTFTHTQQSGRLTEDRGTKAKSNLLENNKESWKGAVREKLKGKRREEEQEPEGRKR